MTPEELMGLVKPDELIPIGNGQRMRPEAAAAFKQMQNAAREAGIDLTGVSSYRDYNWQLDKVKSKVGNSNSVKSALNYSAYPGASRHHWGTEVDINDTRSGGSKYWDTAEGKKTYDWLNQNAVKYGFFQPYDKDRRQEGGHGKEEWHWSYAPLSNRYLEEYNKKIDKGLLVSTAEKYGLKKDVTDVNPMTYVNNINKSAADKNFVGPPKPENVSSQYDLAGAATSIYKKAKSFITGKEEVDTQSSQVGDITLYDPFPGVKWRHSWQYGGHAADLMVGARETQEGAGTPVGLMAGDPSGKARITYIGHDSSSRGRGDIVHASFTDKNNKEYTQRYVHLQNVKVKKGDVVGIGEKIAELGNYYYSSPHLHTDIFTEGGSGAYAGNNSLANEGKGNWKRVNIGSAVEKLAKGEGAPVPLTTQISNTITSYAREIANFGKEKATSSDNTSRESSGIKSTAPRPTQTSSNPSTPQQVSSNTQNNDPASNERNAQNNEVQGVDYYNMDEADIFLYIICAGIINSGWRFIDSGQEIVNSYPDSDSSNSNINNYSGPRENSATSDIMKSVSSFFKMDKLF